MLITNTEAIKKYIDQIIPEYIELRESFLSVLNHNPLTNSRGSLPTVITAGNGGSASTAEHLSSDLMARGVPSMCLSGNTSFLTGIANDISYVRSLSKGLECFSSDKIILVVFSVSGNSENLIDLVDLASDRGVPVFSLLGKDGGLLKKKSWKTAIVKSDDYGLVESLHLLGVHILAQGVKEI